MRAAPFLTVGSLLIAWMFGTTCCGLRAAERLIHARWAPKTVQLGPEERTTIMGYRARLTGHLMHLPMPEPRFYPQPDIFGFVDTADTMVFSVDVPADGAYAVAVLCNARPDLLPGMTLEVVHEGTSLTVRPQHAQTPPGSSRLTFERMRLPGALNLRKGRNEIVVRLRELPDAQRQLATREVARGRGPARDGSFRVWSLELARDEAIAAMSRRAEALRSSTQWMIEGRYGLFTHWSPLCYPLHGDVQTKDRYQQAVAEFDVDAYVGMVVETGAAWVVFTTSHGPHYWPGPNETIDRLLPGRTCRRDLIGELADALSKHHIRLMLYYHTGCDDQPWADAAGMLQADPRQYFGHLVALHEEVSRRYGTRLASSAVYIDTSPRTLYQLDCPYERITRAVKSGNPDAIVGYSTDRLPMLTRFADIPSQDGAAWAEGPLPEPWFAPGRAYDGLQRARFLFLDDWIPRQPLNGRFPAPRLETEQCVRFFKEMAERRIPVTINLLITQDVQHGQPFVNPDSLAIMRQVRRAVRGK